MWSPSFLHSPFTPTRQKVHWGVALLTMMASEIMSTDNRSVGEKVRSELRCAVVHTRLPQSQSDRSFAAFFLGEGAKTKEERRLVQKIGKSKFRASCVSWLLEYLQLTGLLDFFILVNATKPTRFRVHTNLTDRHTVV